MTNTFQQRLQNLNPEQRRAVESIEGPVMVIAGPGTGKTEVLAARIANILLKTDSKAGNILCLTFTDAGTIAMRKRLMEFIGPEAYKVNIYTFHAFCNEVIQQNLDYFGKRELTLVSDLEIVQFLETLVDSFPTGHPLYHVSSYYEVERLKHLFNLMKSENWTEKDVITASDDYLKSLRQNPDFLYKRANSSKGIKIGDVNERLLKVETEKMEKLKAAAKEFTNYEKFLREKGRYDYQDMICWVVKAFKENENMLADYQERFLYILVDEYQDTNGSQNEILSLLTDFWDEANIFIVGDDDQSIFRFQGANLRNIMSFHKKHPNAEKIVITKNYRSSQNILSTAKTLIEGNSERLVNEIPGLEKNLTASNADVADSKVQPKIFEYYSTAHEEAGIVEIIENLQRNGTNMEEVAVIYNQHRQAGNVIKLLEEKKIPLNVKESVNILDLPFTKTILNILSFISGEFENPYSMENVLFHLLHYEFFDIPVRDIAMLSAKLKQMEREHRAREKVGSATLLHTASFAPCVASCVQLPGLEPRLRELIADETVVRSIVSPSAQEKVLKIGKGLDKWTGMIPKTTLLELIETVFSEAGILDFAINGGVWHMRMLKSFYDFLKEECRKNPNLELKNFLKMISQMREHGIALPLGKMTLAPRGVNFMTAHASKGLEFKYVIVMGCQKHIWDTGQRTMGRYAFPETLTLSNEGDDLQEKRRLFYVATTRAKEHLLLTYSVRDWNDKEIEMSTFLAEILGKNKDNITVEQKIMSDENIMRYHRSLMSSVKPKNQSILEKEYIDDLLKDYKLSPTHLNKYLKCPVSFYFENVICVPRPMNENMAFGSAIHYALEHFFKNAKKHSAFGDKDLLLGYFKRGMQIYQSSFTDIQFKKRSDFGAEILKGYFDRYRESWNTNVRLEYYVWNAHMDGVPISGKIDKVEFTHSVSEANLLCEIKSEATMSNAMDVTIIDYKTGNFSNALSRLKRPTENDPLGGDYWRQMVFYKILTDADSREPWHMTSGEFDFLEADHKTGEYKKVRVDITKQDVDIVKSQIKDVYSRIMSHQFSEGCGDESCDWCAALASRTDKAILCSP